MKTKWCSRAHLAVCSDYTMNVESEREGETKKLCAVHEDGARMAKMDVEGFELFWHRREICEL